MRNESDLKGHGPTTQTRSEETAKSRGFRGPGNRIWRSRAACRNVQGGGARNDKKELLLMIVMGIPGIGMLLFGFKTFHSTGQVTAPGLVLVCAGACLIIATGYYHYRKDYRSQNGGGLVFFLLLTVVPGFIGMLVSRLLVRH